MKTIKLKNSKILIGEKLNNVTKYIKNDKIIVITDENILKNYKIPFKNIISLKPGEKTKSLTTIEYITKKLLAYEVDRNTFILGIGGGVVSDITGFISSIFMRGLHFGFVSTTLLSQVDASIGGKNGVNFSGFKNILGTFSQPDFIISDLSMLKTLNNKEYISGLSEVIKYGLILDKDFFYYLEENSNSILNKNIKNLEYIVQKCSSLKCSIVENDEKEIGIRKILNFGHTFGHAIEKLTGMSHGEAISIGMIKALNLSNTLSTEEVKRVINLLNTFGLPTASSISTKKLITAIKKDKKRNNNYIDFILLKKIGEYTIKQITFKELEELC